MCLYLVTVQAPDPESFVWGGSYLKTFFDEGRREDPNNTKSEPSSAHQRNAIQMAFSLAGWWWFNIECWLDSFVIFLRIRAGIAKKSYSFVIFQEGGLDPLSPIQNSHMLWSVTVAFTWSFSLTHGRILRGWRERGSGSPPGKSQVAIREAIGAKGSIASRGRSVRPLLWWLKSDPLAKCSGHACLWKRNAIITIESFRSLLLRIVPLSLLWLLETEGVALVSFYMLIWYSLCIPL